MKTTLTSLPVILLAVLGIALVSVIAIVAFFLPIQARQTNTGNPVDVIEAVPATALPMTPNVEFTLETVATAGKLGFEGVGGDIDGVLNPDLVVQPGDVVRLILVNGDGMPHDLFFPDLDTGTKYVYKTGDRTEIIFEVIDLLPDEYVYYCTVPGHRQAGQEGRFIVREVSK